MTDTGFDASAFIREWALDLADRNKREAEALAEDGYSSLVALLLENEAFLRKIAMACK